MYHKCVRELAHTQRTTLATHHADYVYSPEASHSIPTQGACNTVVRARKGLKYPTTEAR